jgi:cytosine/adenosine deaminase-related metal-dependent hydrolase
MRGFEPMTLANMRLNGIRTVIASCANCGRSGDVNVDLLSETLTVLPPGIPPQGRALPTIGTNGRQGPRLFPHLPPIDRERRERPEINQRTGQTAASSAR